jgi:hypothetical protein
MQHRRCHEKKNVINETGKESNEIDPDDLQQIRKNVRSNEEERETSNRISFYMS